MGRPWLGQIAARNAAREREAEHRRQVQMLADEITFD